MRQPAFSGFGHNRLRKRMLGFHLDGCGVLQQIEGGPVGIAAKVYNTVADDHVGDARLPFGEPLNKTPRRAAPPIAERMDAGVLMISAHGDATTITVMAR
jgi:hypothetical protein